MLVGHHKQDGGISPGHQYREGSSVPRWGHTKGHRHLKSNSGPCQPNNDRTLPLEKAAEKFLTLGEKSPTLAPKPRNAQYRKLSLKKPYTPRGLQQGGLGRPGPGFHDCLHQEQSLGLGSFHSHSEEPEMNTQGLDPCPLAGSHPSGGTDGNGGRSLRPREVTVDMVRAMGRRRSQNNQHQRTGAATMREGITPGLIGRSYLKREVLVLPANRRSLTHRSSTVPPRRP